MKTLTVNFRKLVKEYCFCEYGQFLLCKYFLSKKQLNKKTIPLSYFLCDNCATKILRIKKELTMAKLSINDIILNIPEKSYNEMENVYLLFKEIKTITITYSKLLALLKQEKLRRQAIEIFANPSYFVDFTFENNVNIILLLRKNLGIWKEIKVPKGFIGSSDFENFLKRLPVNSLAEYIMAIVKFDLLNGSKKILI